MATYNQPQGDLTAGLASNVSDTLNPDNLELVTGDTPSVMAMDLPMAANAVLPALTVVGFDVNGNIVEANNGAVAAIGVVVYDSDSTGQADGAMYTGVYRMGVFNPDRLVWNAAYVTDEDKRLAFEGAPSPTAIVIRKPAAKGL